MYKSMVISLTTRVTLVGKVDVYTVFQKTTADHDVVWSMWAEDHCELFSCVHLNREWLFHAKYHEFTGVFSACPPDWAQGPPLLCNEREYSDKDSSRPEVVLLRWENPWENPTWRHNDVILWVSK